MRPQFSLAHQRSQPPAGMKEITELIGTTLGTYARCGTAATHWFPDFVASPRPAWSPTLWSELMPGPTCVRVTLPTVHGQPNPRAASVPTGHHLPTTTPTPTPTADLIPEPSHNPALSLSPSLDLTLRPHSGPEPTQFLLVIA